MIDRYKLVTRHNPILESIDLNAPLSVGNGDFAYTVDITGMQSLYDAYKGNNVPLCTMSNWGWHTTPVSSKRYAYTMDDLEMTAYDYKDRIVTYAVESKPGNEAIYHWLRQNPHRLNLGRIGMRWEGSEINPAVITDIYQQLKLYEGVIESRFALDNNVCRVVTSCDDQRDVLAFEIESQAFEEKKLTIALAFPYGASDITASDWKNPNRHSTKVIERTIHQVIIQREIDKTLYYVGIQSEEEIEVEAHLHELVIGPKQGDQLHISVQFSPVLPTRYLKAKEVIAHAKSGWENFWNKGGVVELYRSKDPRALELERRIIQSQYLLAIQSSGSMPPQETGLTCNSWYGKFHLEMHLWHAAYLPLWNQTDLLKRSLKWYKDHLNEARYNARRNGYKGARWPKMVAYDGIDSPSPIATLLIWQQPHIIYMLELAYQSEQLRDFLEEYWEVVRETADFMSDYAMYNEETKHYDLCAPLIPAQEEHDPKITHNPTFEVAYWSFGLQMAIRWAKRLEKDCTRWEVVANQMADLPVQGDVYLAHEKCTDTYERFNKDHPSMVASMGLLSGEGVCKETMKKTLYKVLECWDYSTMWGWDFAMMAMTAVRLHEPELAIDILLKDTSKNRYVASGNNFQELRSDLPLYLPGNGSLLLAIPLMVAGYGDETNGLPGFPKDGMWEVTYENISAYPY